MKLRVLLSTWIERNGEHAEEFQRWAERAGEAEEPILTTVEMRLTEADTLDEALAEAREEDVR